MPSASAICSIQFLGEKEGLFRLTLYLQGVWAAVSEALFLIHIPSWSQDIYQTVSRQDQSVVFMADKRESPTFDTRQAVRLAGSESWKLCMLHKRSGSSFWQQPRRFDPQVDPCPLSLPPYCVLFLLTLGDNDNNVGNEIGDGKKNNQLWARRFLISIRKERWIRD